MRLFVWMQFNTYSHLYFFIAFLYQQCNMSPIKPERGFLDPVGPPPLQDRRSEHPTHENGASHEDEDVQLVCGIFTNDK